MDDTLKKLLHDLQGPLTVVQGFLRTIDEKALPSADQRELFEAAKTSLEKIKSLISNTTVPKTGQF